MRKTSPERLALIALFLLPAVLGSGPAPADGRGVVSSDPNVHIIKGLAPLSGGEPFRLSASFRLIGQPGRKVEGSYLLEWVAPGTWREEVRYPRYSRVRSAENGLVSQSASTPIQPLRLFNLEELLSWVARHDLAPDDKEGGAPAEPNPIEVGMEPTDDPLAGGEVVSGQRPTTPVLPGRVEIAVRGGDNLIVGGLGTGFPFTKKFRFEDVRSFRGRSVPRKLVYSQRGKNVVKLTIDELTDREIEEPPAPPESSVEWVRVGCKRFEAARVTRFENISIPVGGELFAARYVIGTDGKLHDLVVLRSAGPDHDLYYKSELRHQQWQPALCDGIPVDTAMLYTTETDLAIGIGEAAGRLPGRSEPPPR